MPVDQPTGNLTQRSAWWGMLFTEMLSESAELRALMPEEEFQLVVMPADDPEVTMYQLGLNARGAPDKLVFVRIERLEDRYSAVPYLPHPPQAHAAR